MKFSNWSLLLWRNAIDFTFWFYIWNIANLLLVWKLSFLVFHLLSWDPMGFSISPGSPIFIYLGLAEWLVGSYFPNQGSNLYPRQWKRGVLTTGLLRNSLGLLIFHMIVFSNCTYIDQNGPGRPQLFNSSFCSGLAYISSETSRSLCSKQSSHLNAKFNVRDRQW